MRRAPLRVGLIIGGDSVPRWVALMLDRLDGCPFAEIVGVVRNAQPPAVPIRTGRSHVLYRAYSRLDARRFGAGVNPFDELDLSDRLGGLPALDANGRLEQWQLYLAAFEICIVEIALSIFWLKYYTYGPAEWLLRCLIYRKWLPNKIASINDTPPAYLPLADQIKLN